MAKPLSSEARGLVLQVVSTVFGVGMTVCAKILGYKGLGVFIIIAGSRVVLVVATMGALLWQRVNPLRSQRKLLLLARGLLGFTVITSMFWSVQLLPLAGKFVGLWPAGLLYLYSLVHLLAEEMTDATVLSRLSPLLIALLAPVLLKEPSTPGLWLALPACIVGVLLIARPAFLFGGGEGRAVLTPAGIIAGLSQAVTQALTRISVRALGSTEPAVSIIISGAVVTLVGGSLLATLLPGQLDVKPSPSAYGLLALMGCMACGLQASSTVSLKLVRVAPAAAVNYLSVVWSIVADYLVFGHTPSPSSLAGAGLICGSTLGLMLWETQTRARREGLKASGRSSSGSGGVEGGVQRIGSVGCGGSRESRGAEVQKGAGNEVELERLVSLEPIMQEEEPEQRRLLNGSHGGWEGPGSQGNTALVPSERGFRLA